MPAPRFFLPLPLLAGQTLALPDDAAHHAVRVLRLRDGDPLTLFNGEGGEYPARLRVAGRSARVELGDHLAREAELPGRLTLAQALPSGDKMDWVIEKAVEVGAWAIQPLAAERSVLKLDGERMHKRLQHWRRVAIAACEQCGRNRVPDIADPLSPAAWLAQSDGAAERVVCDPEAGESLTAWLDRQPAVSALTLMIGPEGGWSPAEHALAARHGVRALRFGERVLRTETAGTALVSAISARLGWV